MDSRLDGRTVVVTRASHQAGELSELLRSVGATPVELPVISIAEPSDGGEALRAALANVREYDWVIFTSVNTVEKVIPLLRASPRNVAAIGPGTSDALHGGGVEADLVPPRYVAEALLDSFPAGDGRILLPRAAVARDALPYGLRAKGWTVDVVEAYRTVEVELDPERLRLATKADAITFTASSTVTSYVGAAGLQHLPPTVACIGPITAATAESLGVSVSVTAPSHTVAGLVAALASHLGPVE